MRTEEFDALTARYQKDERLSAGEAYAKAKQTFLTNSIGNGANGILVELLLDIRQLLKASLNLQASEAVSTRDPKWK